MTERAIGGESRRSVRRVLRAGVIGLMAAVARGWKRGVVVVHVALRTLHRGVRASQREGRLVVIKRGQRPRCGVVALRTVGRKS